MTKPPQKKKKMPATRHGLSRGCTRNDAKEFVDFDYVQKLSPAEADWLDKFSREYYQNSFRRDENIHSPEQVKELYRVNNQRRRDMWNKFDRDFHDPANLFDRIEKKDEE